MKPAPGTNSSLPALWRTAAVQRQVHPPCHTGTPSTRLVAHHLARSGVQYNIWLLLFCTTPCFHVTTDRTSTRCEPGWPGAWMKSTCPPHCLCRQYKPPNKLRGLKPQAPKRRRPRTCNHRPALKCPSYWDTFARHINLCTSHREVCHTTLQHVARVSWTVPVWKDFKACFLSGIRSWPRSLILTPGVMGEGSSSSRMGWGGSTVAPMCTQQDLKHSGQQLLKAIWHQADVP